MKTVFQLLITLVVLTINASAAEVTKIAISATPNNLVPFFSTDANSQNINRLVHLSLIDFDQKMNVICRLCESFEEKRNGDQYSVIFKIKKGVKFWDNTEVSISDFKQSLKYFTDKEVIKSNFRFAFDAITDIKELADGRIEFVYNKYGLDQLSNLVLFKILKLKDGTDLSAIKLENIIGAGEYKYGEVTPENVILEPLLNNYPKISFVVVKDETTLSLKLMNGEVDVSIAEMSPRKIEFLEKTGRLKIIKQESTNYNYIGINHKRDHFKDVKMREAFAHLVPREKIIEYKFKNNAVLSTGLFSKAFDSLYVDDQVDFNPKKAEELFIASGAKKVNGKWNYNGKELKILWKSTNNKFALEIVEIIKTQFEKFGISVELVVQEWGTFLKGLKAGEYDFFIGKWVGFTGPDMLKFAFYGENIPPKGANRGFFQNKEVDELLDLAEKESDLNTRNSIYRKATHLVNINYAYINLWHPSVIWVMKKCIEIPGLYPNGNLLALRNLTNECREGKF